MLGRGCGVFVAARLGGFYMLRCINLGRLLRLDPAVIFSVMCACAWVNAVCPNDVHDFQVKKKQRFDEAQILDWFWQICMAVRYCHKKRVFQRDLKTQNIFLSSDGVVKLGQHFPSVSKYA
jgi:serine/threonine protein kinase